METNPDGKRLQEDLFLDSGLKLSREYPVFVKHKDLVTNEYAVVIKRSSITLTWTRALCK